MIADWLRGFFDDPGTGAGPVYNERSLQLELAFAFRRDGFRVEFERPFPVPRLDGSTLRPKQNLDLLVAHNGDSAAIELKVPLSGQHPETMYAFCADIEFVEALKRAGIVAHGFCALLTNDKVFWEDSGRGSPMHNLFRCTDTLLAGVVQRPTGPRDTMVVLSGSYSLAGLWSAASCRLMSNARFLLVQI